MHRGKSVRRRSGLIGLLIFALTVGPALSVFGGGGFFRRRARSHGSSVAVRGSWGSHGATGGGRVIYTPARPIQSSQFAPQQTHATYASHGATGGSPQRHVVNQTARAYYPANRVVVRRETVAASPIASTSHQNPTPGSASKTPQIEARPTPIVPPSPNKRVLERFANSSAETDLAAMDLRPLSTLLATLDPTPTGTALATHHVMKPAILDVHTKDNEETGLDADLRSLPMELPTDEPSIPTLNESPRLHEAAEPELDATKLESPELEATERRIEKVETIRSVQTDRSATDSDVHLLAADETLADRNDEVLSEANIPQLELDASPASEVDAISQQRLEPLDDSTATLNDVAVATQVDDIRATEVESIVDTNPEPEGPTLAEQEEQPAETEEASSDEPTGLQSILVRTHKRADASKPQEEVEAKPDVSPQATQQETSDPVRLRARLVLHVPESADVYLMDHKMNTMGSTRHFNVPLSDPIRDHTYTIRVVSQNGVVVESTQRLRAGQRLELTFNGQAGTLALQP